MTDHQFTSPPPEPMPADTPQGNPPALASQPDPLEVMTAVLDIIAIDLPDIDFIAKAISDDPLLAPHLAPVRAELDKARGIVAKLTALNGVFGLIPKDVATSAADIADPDATPEEIDAFLEAIGPDEPRGIMIEPVRDPRPMLSTVGEVRAWLAKYTDDAPIEWDHLRVKDSSALRPTEEREP